MTTHRPTVVSVIAACAAAITLSTAHPQSERPATRARMHAIFDALSTVLNLSLYETPFEAPKNRTMVMDALGVLAENAEGLDTHGAELNPSFDYLRRSLTRDANEAILRYRQEQYEGARFVLDQLIQNCVACHSKLPGRDGFDLARKFVERGRVEELPPVERARLLVATRQFDLALDAYEMHIRSTNIRAHEIAVSGVMGEYLKTCVRVLNDGDRARRLLESFSRRDDVTGYLHSQVEEWTKVMESWDSSEEGLSEARRLVQEARQRNAFPADRHGLAHFVIASGMLQRFLESRPEDPAEITEAYYLLGVCESHVTRSFWVSETEFYLESAVTTKPSSPYARLALEFLEAYVTAEYTGSSGIMVPEEVQERLNELRDLVEQAP